MLKHGLKGEIFCQEVFVIIKNGTSSKGNDHPKKKKVNEEGNVTGTVYLKNVIDDS